MSLFILNFILIIYIDSAAINHDEECFRQLTYFPSPLTLTIKLFNFWGLRAIFGTRGIC